MTAEEAAGKIEQVTDSLDHATKAELAAMLMNEVDPTKDNIEKFLDTLDDTPHDEFICRCDLRPSRADS